jgi:hemolysin III
VLSHGLAAVAGIAGLVLLVVAAAKGGGAVRVTSASLYGATLVTLYVASTLYHAVPGGAAKGVFRILDHSAIFLLIAGSYTPFCLVAIGGPVGWTLLAVVWALALAGVVLTAVAIARTRVVAMVLYLGMGWCIVMAAGPVVRALDPMTLLLLVIGGVTYTGGLVFYARRFRFAHTVWHLFVIAASGLHWWAVYRVVA